MCQGWILSEQKDSRFSVCGYALRKAATEEHTPMLLLLLCTEAVISKKPWTKSQAVRTHNLSETTRRPLQGISQFYRISLHTSSIIGICLLVLPQGSVQQSSERQDLWSVKASTIKIQRCKSTSRFRAQRLFDHTSIQKRGAVNGCCCQLSSVMPKPICRT